MIVVACFGVPALYILLAMVDAPVLPGPLAAATSRALGRTGIVLAGLAPGAALFMVTSTSDAAVRMVAVVGLTIGGGVGLRALVRELGEAATTSRSTRYASLGIAGAFTAFAVALAMRLWESFLPVLGGGA
jgi:hypothetical protein